MTIIFKNYLIYVFLMTKTGSKGTLSFEILKEIKETSDASVEVLAERLGICEANIEGT